MENLTILTQYAFELLDRLVDVINSNILLQFACLLVFAYFAVSCLKNIITDDDTDGKGGIVL